VDGESTHLHQYHHHHHHDHDRSARRITYLSPTHRRFVSRPNSSTFRPPEPVPPPTEGNVCSTATFSYCVTKQYPVSAILVICQRSPSATRISHSHSHSHIHTPIHIRALTHASRGNDDESSQRLGELPRSRTFAHVGTLTHDPPFLISPLHTFDAPTVLRHNPPPSLHLSTHSPD
jgi:hypothetical protein